jgi:AraC family transcriptional regulator of adaptative response/methylated-DNA-[protein]-cysteine methyltransferase
MAKAWPTPGGYNNEASRWVAVQTRDRAADGAFYYGVRSTGVYCRPSCPSRRPARDNVVFFETPENAKQAGFRPCKRCHPDSVTADQLAVARALGLIESNEDAPSLDELAGEVGLSPPYLQRVFKRQTGLSPRQYAASLRQQRFRAGLREAGTVTAAVYEAGFGSTRSAYERAGEQLGMRPSVFKRGGRGERITYAIAESDLGHLLVGRTQRGICAVYLGTPEELRDALAQEFPEAGRVEDMKAMSNEVRSVNEVLAASGVGGGLQLDAHGSEFQQRVWAALREIPAGETRTYSQVAEAIGQPGAARAVARACASNPLALLTPCHRVVRADGVMGGYRWGIERKRALLEREGTIQ